MRIDKIYIRNLASLSGEHIIDFSATPLADAGLFCITGETGSGKSTLLDAMSLALYGIVNRYNLPNTKKTEEGDDENPLLKNNDVFNIITRNCTEAEAKVWFTANDGKQYSAHWTGKIGKTKKGEITTKRTHILICEKGGDGERWDLPKDDKGKVQEVIGLGYEQFVRTMLLAQGNFSAFLTSQPAEKAKLLEKLTGTDIYTKVGLKITELHDEAKRDRDLCRRAYDTILTGFDENFSVEKTKEEIDNNNMKLNLLRKKIEELVENKKWWETFNNLTQTIKTAEIVAKRAEEEYEAEVRGAMWLNVYDDMQEVRDSFVSYSSLWAEVEEIDKEVGDRRKEAERAGALLKVCEGNVAKYAEATEKAKRRMAEEEPKIQEALTLEAQRVEKKKAREEAEASLAQKNTQAKQTEAARQQDKKKADGQRMTMEEFVAKNASYIQQPRETQTAKELGQLYENSNNEYGEYGKAYKALEIWIEEQEKKRMAEEQLSLLRPELKKCEEAAKENAEKENALDTSIEKLRESIQAIESKDVESLRGKLKEGEECPVCGSKVHPYKSAHTVQSVAGGLHANLDEMKKMKVNLRKQIDETNAKRSKIAEDIGKNETEKKNAEAQMTARKNEWGRIKLSGLMPIESETKENIIEKGKKAHQAADWYKEHRDIAEKQEEYEQIKKSLDNATEAVRKSEANLKAVKEEVAEIEKKCQQKREEEGTVVRRLAELYPNGFSTGMEEKLKKEIEKAEAEEKKNREEMAVAMKRHSEAEAKAESAAKSLKEKKEKMENAKEGVMNFLSEYNAQRGTAYAMEDVAKILGRTNEVAATRERMKKKGDTLTTAKAHLTQKQEEMKAHETKKPNTDEAQTKAEIAEKERLRSEIEQEVGRLTNNIEQHQKMEANAKAAKKRLADAQTLFDNWDDLYKCICQNKDAEAFTIFTQTYTLKFLIENANYHLAHLNKRYTLKQRSGTLNISIIDNDRGGEERTVTSLSGGETFIISLALALGLSTLSDSGAQLQNLFIDEGFGTLDAENLNIVVDALSDLQHSLNKKVGVISHTQDMKERISTQIMVKRNMGTGHSRVEIKG